MYSCHVFLICSASIRSLPFLSFIVPSFTWKFPLASPIFLKRSVCVCLCVCVCTCALSHVWLLVTPWSVACQAPFSWNFPGKNTRVGCHFLLQGIFLTQGLNPHLLHWQVDSLPLHHLGSPKRSLVFSILLYSSVYLLCSLRRVCFSLFLFHFWNSFLRILPLIIHNVFTYLLTTLMCNYHDCYLFSHSSVHLTWLFDSVLLQFQLPWPY